MIHMDTTVVVTTKSQLVRLLELHKDYIISKDSYDRSCIKTKGEEQYMLDAKEKYQILLHRTMTAQSVVVIEYGEEDDE